MLPESTVHKILDLGTTRGADFAEVFVEESETSGIELVDRKIDLIGSGNAFGVGVRLIRGGDSYYGYSSDDSEPVLIQLTENLVQQAREGRPAQPLHPASVADRHTVRVDPGSVPKRERLDLLRRMDGLTRDASADVRQVSASVHEKRRAVLIANSEGLWVEDSRRYSRLRLAAIAEVQDGPQSASESPGVLGGYEFFQGLDVERIAGDTARRAETMARAGYIEGGMMPVVLGNGFGGVIFHEACGHPLETEAVRKDASPFAGKVGEAVGQPILTAIDDGTLANHWGSYNVDDEGLPPQKTVLIDRGVLKGYMSDRIGAGQAGVSRTGSARRESYKFAPVSRMRNTYIDRGPHQVEDMIRSIDFGLFAKKIGGGSVDSATGEFNFAVEEGYAIRGGKLAEPVRGATLTGKGHEVLPLISMIGSDLELSAGMCGATSGWVPVCVGQPTLKIDRILVGGR